MNTQGNNTKYPKHFQEYRAPEINIPFGARLTKVILRYFTIQDENEKSDPRKRALCKTCDKVICIIVGSSAHSSYTRGLKYHLKSHSKEWDEYLQNLASSMTPDSKSKYEHFKQMDGRYKPTNKEESSGRLYECQRNGFLSPKNSAGVEYSKRDSEFLKDKFYILADYENARMFEHLFQFTNKNLTLYDLMGTKHPNANLQANYRKSKCLVDNVNNLTVDLERYLCEYMCFFDPNLYDGCPNSHKGDIFIFSSKEFQSSFPGFLEEIEKYPEFQVKQTFDHEILKEVSIVEDNKTALVEMNLLLKIIITMVNIRNRTVAHKIDGVIAASTDENNLVKPELAIQMWGPKYFNVDIPEEFDNTKHFEESRFSTFQHVDDSDCPAFHDASKKIYSQPFIQDGKVHYPCNVGGCARECECPPCSDGTEMRCPDHHPDHPEMFHPDEDISYSRKILFDSKSKMAIFKRPLFHPELCPPKLELAGMKKICRICRTNSKIHLKYHLTLHSDVCEICYHKEFISKNSFELICYICMKSFKNKYRLKDHMNIHEPENNPYSCKVCDKGFTTKYGYERHIMQNHRDNSLVFTCTECENSYISEQNLMRHVETNHIGKAEHICNICEKPFSRKDVLKKHQKIVHQIDKRNVTLPGIKDGENLFDCHICEKTFKEKSVLNRHLETVHNDNCARYHCNECDKQFKRKDHLQKHNTTHNKIICEICLKQFKTKDGLKAHRIGNHD